MKLRTFTALLLAAIMLFALTACGSQAADDSSSDQQQEQQDTTTNESNEFVIKCSKSPLCLGSLVTQGPNAPSFPQQHTNGVYLGFIFIKSEKSYIGWNSSVGRATHS